MKNTFRKRAWIVVSGIFFFFLLGTVSISFAHKVQIFAYGEGDSIVTKSYFSSGKGAQNSQIIVLDMGSGKTLLEGVTDTEGVFQFPISEDLKRSRSDLKIILNTGEGHRAEWLLTAEEYLEGLGDDGKDPAAEKQSEAPRQQETKLSAPKAGGPGCDEQVIAGIVEEALDKKLAPLKEMIRQSQDKGPSVQNVIGGIGYIIGLAGLAAYIVSRRKR